MSCTRQIRLAPRRGTASPWALINAQGSAALLAPPNQGAQSQRLPPAPVAAAFATCGFQDRSCRLQPGEPHRMDRLPSSQMARQARTLPDPTAD